MKVRTNQPHGIPVEEATTRFYKVAELPDMDFAAKKLHDVQSAYFKRFPDAKKWAHCLIWTLEEDPGAVDQHGYIRKTEND